MPGAVVSKPVLVDWVQLSSRGSCMIARAHAVPWLLLSRDRQMVESIGEHLRLHAAQHFRSFCHSTILPSVCILMLEGQQNNTRCQVDRVL